MKLETVSLRLEKRRDATAREALLNAAFGDTRFAKTCERLRETNRAADGLSLVAVKEGRLIGTLRLWPVVTGDGRSALLLGPLAVDQAERSAGIGARLMRLAIKRARRAGQAVFGITVDREAKSWFPRIFGQGGFALIPQAEKLTVALPAIYRHLVQG